MKICLHQRKAQLVGLGLFTLSTQIVPSSGSLRSIQAHPNRDSVHEENLDYETFRDAIKVIQSAGIDISPLCQASNNDYRPLDLLCHEIFANALDSKEYFENLQTNRKMQTENEPGDDNDNEENTEEELSQREIIVNLTMSVLCVTLAALAAGLTMGLLSLDPLELHIKKRASEDEDERVQSAALLPVVQNHHRLLVTLLLLNSIANEALPLFLDELVPGYVAVILSVTLVLFFGEIIPSAIFTGPNQLAIAAKLVPLVKTCLFILTPLAWPIAKMLDILLGENHEDGGKYDRRELSALVRIMYEERLAEKKRRKNRRLPRSKSVRNEMRDRIVSTRSSLRMDEVTIVEGVLQMNEKCVKDVFTPWKKVKCEKKSEILDRETIDRLYHHGHSRIPIYDESSKNHSKRNISKAISGMCLTRDLIVLRPKSDMNKARISDLRLYQPPCISPTMNLVDALNRLQNGLVGQSKGHSKGGHLAIVCSDPGKATSALEKGLPIPEDANVIGVVSLEDVIEAIIQEEIYDETDQRESIRDYGSTRNLT